jgi:hypothetical protein
MARRCSVGTSPAREAVERDLLTGRPVSRIAADTGLAATSIRRHRDRHLGPKLAEALARRETIDADKLLDWLTGLHDKTLLGIARTEAKADWGAMRGFIREARANIELLGRLAGIIDPAPSTFIDARRQTAVLAARCRRRSCGRSRGPPRGLTSRRSVSSLLSPCPRSSMGTGVER